MNLEEDLRTTLADVSESCHVPELDVTELLARGQIGARRHARRRQLKTVLAVAAVGACAIAVTTFAGHARRADTPIHQPAAPVRVQDLPVGAPPSIPFCSAGKQILGAGQPIASDCMTLVHRGTGTVGVAKAGVFQVEHGRTRLLDRRRPSIWFPVLSQDGHYAAWVVRRGAERSLLVYELHSGAVVADVPLPTSSAWVVGIDDLHRVYVQDLAGGSRVWMFDVAGHRLIRLRDLPPGVSGADYVVNYATRDGLAIGTSRFWVSGRTSDSIEGTVTSDGHFVAGPTVPVGWSLWSPDRSELVQETADGFWVQRRGALNTKVVLRLPKVGRVTSTPVWESEDSVLVSFDPALPAGRVIDDNRLYDLPTDDLWILRCSAQTGLCQVALPPGNAGPDLHGSMLW